MDQNRLFSSDNPVVWNHILVRSFGMTLLGNSSRPASRVSIVQE